MLQPQQQQQQQQHQQQPNSFQFYNNGNFHSGQPMYDMLLND
jgi:hypothetical protein